MIKRAIVPAILSALLVCGCGIGLRPQPYAGTLPARTDLDMAGTFTLAPTGELELVLAEPCSTRKLSQDERSVEVPCSRRRLDEIRVTAVSPWLDHVPGKWKDSNRLTFTIDWGHVGLDLLASDASEAARKPWDVSGTRWTPTEIEAARILQLIGRATSTETELVSGGARPNLEVTGIEVDHGGLRVGDRNTLAVTIANRGPGTAYRVAATMRSSIEGLHGRRLSFGIIRPGETKVRQLDVAVPGSEIAPDTMLVLAVSEGNGFAPATVNRRMPITVSQASPLLAVRCTIPDHPGARPDVPAGSSVVVHCVVENTGNVAAQAEIDTTVGDSAVSQALLKGDGVNSGSIKIAAAGRASVDVPVTVPRDLPIDTAVELVVAVTDRSHARVARTALVVMIRKPQLCAPGQLTRSQYRSKLAGLRDAVKAGDLTPAQLDRYDAELVSCLR